MNEIEKAVIEEGHEYNFTPYNFIPHQTSFEVPSMDKAKISEFIEKAEEGNVINIVGCKILIGHLSKIMEKRKEERDVHVLLFSKTPGYKNAYGEKNIDYVLKGEGGQIFLNGKRIKHGLYSFSGRFELSLSKDKIEKEIYGEVKEIINISKASLISAKDENGRYGWKEKRIKSFSSPILALSDAIRRFGKENVGAVIIGKKYYPNPFITINHPLILNKIHSEKELLRKLYYAERFNNLKRVENSLIYLMNFNGKVREYNERLKKKERWMEKEVIIGEDIYKIIKDNIVKDIDYYEIEGIKISKLATIIQSLVLKKINKKIVLKYTQNSLNIKLSLKKVLREATVGEYKEGDIEIKHKVDSDELSVTYSKSPQGIQFLTFSEKYLITKIRKGSLIVVF